MERAAVADGKDAATLRDAFSKVLCVFILLLIGVFAFSIRLFSVIKYESVIHEFDPYFNYRVTQFLTKSGIYDFWNWFDDRTWYPLGRVIGGTVYPGLTLTAGSIWWLLNSVNIPLTVETVCVFTAPIFSANAAWATYLLTKEIKGTGAGLTAATLLAMVPSYISRSVAGSYDNEAVAIFALIFTFYLYIKTLNTGSLFYATLNALAYFYMVCSWGGYTFIINLIPMHVLLCIVTGRYSPRLYIAYAPLVVLGTLLASLVPVVGFNAVMTSEHFASFLVFIIIHVVALVYYVKGILSPKMFKVAMTLVVTFGVVICLAVLAILVALVASSPTKGWSGRSLSLLDPTYASKYIPIIASVSEHQPPTWPSYFMDINVLAFLVPAGIIACFSPLSDASSFVVLYIVTSVYFSGVMVRLMLVFAPAACIMSGIALSEAFDVFTQSIKLQLPKLFGNPDPDSGDTNSEKSVEPNVVKVDKPATTVKTEVGPRERPSKKNRKKEKEIVEKVPTKRPKEKHLLVLPLEASAVSILLLIVLGGFYVEMKAQGVIEERLQLLKGVTGAFRPGVLTALMGVSGAGKTTLMDVLAGRKTGGYTEGDIRISGYPKDQETFARISGYCEQTDIHSAQITVRESLIFSAFLRLPKEVSDEVKTRFVDEVMGLVELGNLKDAIVGIPGVTGVSTEQRKRLTIAVELVANPSIIFLDEPTSGLDARAAAIVMRTVRNTVDTGRTVVCTIHQPSIDIFESFDELILMKRGGQLIYSGPLGQSSQQIVEYFEAIPGVTKIKDKYNPATWMMEVSSTDNELRLGIDFTETYKASKLFKRNRAVVKELSKPVPGAGNLYFETQYSQPAFEQFKYCLWKQWWNYWRNPEYNLSRLLFSFGASLLIGSIFWQAGKKRESSIDLLVIIGAMYAAVLFVGVVNCITVQTVVALERTVFYREKAAGMYSAIPYALSLVVVEIPYVFVQTVSYALIVYSMMGFEWTTVKFLWFFFISFFTFLYFTYYGMMSVAISPNIQVAGIFSATFYSLFNLFSGFFIPRPRIPKWWIWYYWICPVAWTVYGLIVTQYGDIKDMIKVPGEPDQMIKSYIEKQFGYHLDFMGVVAGVLVGFTVFFAAMFTYSIKTLNFQLK